MAEKQGPVRPLLMRKLPFWGGGFQPPPREPLAGVVGRQACIRAAHKAWHPWHFLHLPLKQPLSERVLKQVAREAEPGRPAVQRHIAMCAGHRSVLFS